MSLINHRAREIHVKIVYYGPGLGGKTTNVRMLHERLPADRRGRLVTIATEQERTLFFDFMPVDLGTVNGFTTRFHLYTVPGQIYYRRSRRAVLQGVDGIVFVADSQGDRERDNVESLEDMRALLGQLGIGAAQLNRLPRVIQYNKRDVPGAFPVERMRAMLNPEGLPEIEAVAVDGLGVRETMRAIAKGVLGRITGITTPAAPPPSVIRPLPAMGFVPPVGWVPPPVATPLVPASPRVTPVATPLVPASPRVTPVATPLVPASPRVTPVATPLVPASPRVTPAPRRKPARRIVPTRG